MQPLLAMFGASPWELIIVLGVVLLLFGHRLPALMRSMGQGVVEFKKGINDTDELPTDKNANNTAEKKTS